jgi:hypothetical protein
MTHWVFRQITPLWPCWRGLVTSGGSLGLPGMLGNEGYGQSGADSTFDPVIALTTTPKVVIFIMAYGSLWPTVHYGLRFIMAYGSLWPTGCF